MINLETLSRELADLNPSEQNARMSELMPHVLLDEIIEQTTLPREAIFLGVADDALPVLLNLHDPTPGPLLVTADDGAGKTNFLRVIAQGITELHNPSDVQFAVITTKPNEFSDLALSENCAGIFPSDHQTASDFVLSLAEWAHANKTNQSIVLLIDEFDITSGLTPEAYDSLRWLLMRGPARKVWPIATLAPEKRDDVWPLLDLFRTRIFGTIADFTAETMLTDPGTPGNFNSLVKGSQFTMREGSEWMRFWIPRLNNEN